MTQEDKELLLKDLCARLPYGVVIHFDEKTDLDDECPVSSPTHEWANVVGNIHDNPEMLKK